MSTLYDVTSMEVGLRYVGEQPVECATFHKKDGTAVVVRLTSSQQDLLAMLLKTWRESPSSARGKGAVT